MKWFILFACFFSFSAYAKIRQIKIDPGLQIKFEDKEWNYHYIKALSSITPHIFESKSKNEIKVVIQKEAHTDSGFGNSNLVQKKCGEADNFYRNSKQGSAKSFKIKNSTVCLIQFIKSDKNNYQIIYPIHFHKSGYELLSFAWQSKDTNSVDEVSSLVRENL